MLAPHTSLRFPLLLPLLAAAILASGIDSASAQYRRSFGGGHHPPPERRDDDAPRKRGPYDTTGVSILEQPPHGGKVWTNHLYFVEVVHLPQETHVFVYGAAQEPLPCQAVRGTLVLQPNGTALPSRYPLNFVQPLRGEHPNHLSTTADVEQIRDGEMSVTVILENLPFPPQPGAERLSFSQPFALSRNASSITRTVYQEPTLPSATPMESTPPRVVGSSTMVVTQPRDIAEPSWYARVDYFHWNERIEGHDFVNEDGPLLTLGYARRIGFERFRGEVFGGEMDYSGGVQYDDGTSEPWLSHTDYLGVRGEYELLFEPDAWPSLTLFAGLGSRLWFRDLADGTAPSGNPVYSYRETWWTFYPYIGLERRRPADREREFFGSARIGCTAFTYEHVSWDDITLYPKIGVTGQVEAGYRGRHLFLSGFFEGMAWEESSVVRDSLQPASRLYTVGLRAGVNR